MTSTLTVWRNNRVDQEETHDLADLYDQFTEHEIAEYPWTMERRASVWFATWAVFEREEWDRILDYFIAKERTEQ